MSRLDYQRQWATGYIINIGCGDTCVDFGPAAINVDIDWWDVPNFLHCDCCKLPFPNKLFDTAVLGDILEHCVDPPGAVREAARIAKRVVMTVPEELRLPSVGQHVAAGIQARAVEYRQQHGFPSYISDEEVVVAHKHTDPKFIKSYPENLTPHDGHINRFDDAAIQELIKLTNMRVIDYQKVPEATWTNWLITLED